MNKLWTDDGWADYLYWQSQDKKTLKTLLNILLYFTIIVNFLFLFFY